MSAFFQTLLKYPFSVTFYLLYTLLCGMVFTTNLRYDHLIKANPGKHGVSFGEGVMYGILFLIMTGAMFVFVLLINAIARMQYKFYLWLVLIIIIQALIAIGAGFWGW